jgi:hypothetical protein
MPATVYYVLAALVGIGLVVWLLRLGRAYLRLRGERVVTCPENQARVGVEIDAVGGALTAAVGGSRVRLQDCTRWPDRVGCDQACLSQIEASPDGCLARGLLTRWYADRACLLCGAPFGEIHWHDHRPALRSPEGRTLAWAEVDVESLPDVLESHQPVCWSCHVAESFRQEHPELVVDRPSRPGRPSGA